VQEMKGEMHKLWCKNIKMQKKKLTPIKITVQRIQKNSVKPVTQNVSIGVNQYEAIQKKFTISI